jgi:hypothetical protein
MPPYLREELVRQREREPTGCSTSSSPRWCWPRPAHHRLRPGHGPRPPPARPLPAPTPAGAGDRAGQVEPAPLPPGQVAPLSRISEHGSYAGAVLGPMLVIAAGLGLLFVPVTLVAMSRVADSESGVAASLRNTGQQVGGSIGLAVLGTVAWTVVANSAHAQAARAAVTAGRAGHPARPSPAALTAIYHHALAAGFSRDFLVTAAIMLLALIITIAAIRVKRAPSRSSPRRTASTATGRSTPPTGTPTGSRRSPPAPRSGRLIPARPRRVPGGLPAAGRGLRPGSVRASAKAT